LKVLPSEKIIVKQLSSLYNHARHYESPTKNSNDYLMAEPSCIEF